METPEYTVAKCNGSCLRQGPQSPWKGLVWIRVSTWEVWKIPGLSDYTCKSEHTSTWKCELRERHTVPHWASPLPPQAHRPARLGSEQRGPPFPAGIHQQQCMATMETVPQMSCPLPLRIIRRPTIFGPDLLRARGLGNFRRGVLDFLLTRQMRLGNSIHWRETITAAQIACSWLWVEAGERTNEQRQREPQGKAGRGGKRQEL